MTGIPYNYGKYIDDTVRLKDQGVVDAKNQVESPASAGSRGLAKTTQFTNDKTQMQMGNSMGNSPMAESIIEIRNILNRIDGLNVPVQEDDGDERAIAAMKVARDESGKEGFDYPEGGTYGYKVKPGEKATDVTLHNRETDEVMQINDLSYLELEKGNEQDTLAMIWDENKHTSKITKEAEMQEATTDRKLLAMVDNLRNEIMEHPRMPDDTKTEVFTSLEEIEQAIHMMNDGQDPATSIQP